MVTMCSRLYLGTVEHTEKSLVLKKLMISEGIRKKFRSLASVTVMQVGSTTSDKGKIQNFIKEKHFYFPLMDS